MAYSSKAYFLSRLNTSSNDLDHESTLYSLLLGSLILFDNPGATDFVLLPGF